MEITLTFGPTTELNTSLQVGDTAWYVPTASAGGYNVASTSSVQKLGRIEEVSFQLLQPQIKVSNYSNVVPSIQNSDFIMFSKDNRANIGNLKGYYAEATLINNSKEKIELFQVGSEIVASSK